MRCAIAVMALLLASCSAPRDHLPDIAALYRESALNEIRNPVVVIHGILGARLEQKGTGRTVWGAFTDDYADPSDPEGARLVALPLAIPQSANGEPDPDVVARGPLETLELSLLFNVISVDVYKDIIRTLGAGMYRDEHFTDKNSPTYADDHFTCFSFFYDWRLDNVTNAMRLGRYLEESRRQIVEKASAKIAKLRAAGDARSAKEAGELAAWLDRGLRFDVVAHSMGGLLSRYYLRFGAKDLPADGSTPAVTWAGSADIDRLILVGTPNLGAIDALRQLTKGYRPASVLPTYDQAILGTMPSIYQLLPRTRHGVVLDASRKPSDVDLFDAEVWQRNRWGILDPAAERTLSVLRGAATDQATRRRQATEYLAFCLKRGAAFHRALDKEPETPCPSTVYLFAADSEPTLARCVLEEHGGRIVPTFPEEKATLLFGDLTVPRYSAIGDERQGKPYSFGVATSIPFRNETFLSDDHIGLTKNPTFSNNLLYILLEKPSTARR